MNEKFMHLAIQEAEKISLDVPVGAVLVLDEKVIASASNKREELKKPTAHAEMIVLDEGAKILGDWRLSSTKLYVTLEPCPMCAAAILQSRVGEVYFGAYDTAYGAFGSKLDMRDIVNSKTKIKGGILEEDCQSLLTDFFEAKR